MTGGSRHFDGPRQKHPGRYIAGCREDAPPKPSTMREKAAAAKPASEPISGGNGEFAHYDHACFAVHGGRKADPIDLTTIKSPKNDGSGRVSCS